MMSTNEFLSGLMSFALVVMICGGLFLALRAVVLWYWKVDTIVANQEKQIHLLRALLEKLPKEKDKILNQ